MGDISFPAHISVRRERDTDGLPILATHVDISGEVAGLDLPTGPLGPKGQRGTPRTTFRKMGEIAGVAARPTSLGPADRGKWWHRLDDNGMDVWTGSGWQHSTNAVGPRGPVGPALSITDIDTLNDPNLTTGAVQFIGSGAQQSLKVTVPAGQAGPQGPPGSSGKINEATDFDATTDGPVHGSVFAYSRAGAKFHATPPPLGAGPWGWTGPGDFGAKQEASTSQLIVGTFTVPALPYAWRPVVQGQLWVYSVNNSRQSAVATVRLFHSQGPVVGASVGVAGPEYFYLSIFQSYRDEQSTKTLAPSSTYAKVAAGESATLVVSAERDGTGTDNIGVNPSDASLIVYAQPL
ncbi:hypothetical protein [Nocardia sp. NPDC051570]|uniref:hypothetical protein n=1 Tax=Nocardia sp. NPDC051570 TaxID=3364324 RepID=UPI0037A9FDB2